MFGSAKSNGSRNSQLSQSQFENKAEVKDDKEKSLNFDDFQSNKPSEIRNSVNSNAPKEDVNFSMFGSVKSNGSRNSQLSQSQF